MKNFDLWDWCILIVVAGMMVGYIIGIWKHGNKEAIQVIINQSTTQPAEQKEGDE